MLSLVCGVNLKELLKGRLFKKKREGIGKNISRFWKGKEKIGRLGTLYFLILWICLVENLGFQNWNTKHSS